ncbi:MAG: hypothetical protein NT001_06870 [Candidatus Woesearchaeota archaeon]|nr:hypothetical protein [Candidatus Woesearchaeota archaeon]
MAKYSYSHQDYNKETMSRAVGRDLNISTKQSIEICNFLRGMNIPMAKTILNDVMELKAAVPFRRFTNGVGHRKGDMASGRAEGIEHIKAGIGPSFCAESIKANACRKEEGEIDEEIPHRGCLGRGP